MLLAIGFYWIVTGMTMFMIVEENEPTKTTRDSAVTLAICLALGGFSVPARILAKVFE